MINEIQELVQAKRKSKINIIVNDLEQLYNRLKDKLPEGGEEEFVRNHDLTGILEKVMIQVIDSGNLINWAVLGMVISGKSTVMGYFVDLGNDYLIHKKELFYNHLTKKRDLKLVRNFDNYNMIVGDQIEFISIINKNLWRCFVGIDEFNRLGETGVNSSIEAIMYQNYSDVFAQQRVHRISCAPSVVSDANCWLILEVIGKDLDNGITRVKVVYRDVISGNKLAIGHADIKVKETIIRRWYKRYIDKKFKRMNLLQKYNVRKISELETAKIILDIYEDLKNKVSVKKIDNDVLLNVAKEFIRKHKYICSMVAEADIISGCRGLLAQEYSINKNSESLEKEKLKLKKSKKKIDGYKVLIEYDKELLNRMLKYQEFLVKLHKEYLQIR